MLTLLGPKGTRCRVCAWVIGTSCWGHEPNAPVQAVMHGPDGSRCPICYLTVGFGCAGHAPPRGSRRSTSAPSTEERSSPAIQAIVKIQCATCGWVVGDGCLCPRNQQLTAPGSAVLRDQPNSPERGQTIGDGCRGHSAKKESTSVARADNQIASTASTDRLSDDLKRLAHETFTNHDLAAGKKLAEEVVGGLVLAGLGFGVLSVALPAVGLPATGAILTRILQEMGRLYSGLDESERKQVRAVVNWVQGGFSLDTEDV